ncbi:hypothetical protein ABZ860_00120 [Microbispora sp. NPDC046973]
MPLPISHLALGFSYTSSHPSELCGSSDPAEREISGGALLRVRAR